MNLNDLPKLKENDNKRLGRGQGSGRGKTSGRGTKGQKARGKVPISFIGGTLALYKKLPYKRGYRRDGIHQSSSMPKKMKPLDLSMLEKLAAKSEVNLQTLTEAGLITKKESKRGVKILSQGEISKALVFTIPVSKAALIKIEKAGGEVRSA